MKLKIRYENEMQTIELDDTATEQLWVSLSLEGEEIPEEERERMIQFAFDLKFNRPEYNCWHRETRYIDPSPKCRLMDGSRGLIRGDEESSGFDVMDYLLTTDDSGAIEDHETCALIRKVLEKKPEWADAFIAVRINGESIRGYAARKGLDENSVSQKLKRAEKKLKGKYPNRQI